MSAPNQAALDAAYNAVLDAIYARVLPIIGELAAAYPLIDVEATVAFVMIWNTAPHRPLPEVVRSALDDYDFGLEADTEDEDDHARDDEDHEDNGPSPAPKALVAARAEDRRAGHEKRAA